MTDHWMPGPQKSGVIWLTGLIIPTHQLGVDECVERILFSFLSTINKQ
ncbi:hypothetical protein [Brevibacillus sp. BC25]|nr:hypothetical protein [Brevibacillus sp. BC25]EJL27407.1 hypothetical protein PMI05_02742 [Brevibacillus sp. BC25]